MSSARVDMEGMALLDALCWVDQTTFPDDLYKGVLEAGASIEVAQEICQAYRTHRPRSVLSFYREWCYPAGKDDDQYKAKVGHYILAMVELYRQRFAAGA